MTFKVAHLHFKTSDPQKTAQWYIDTLGATIVSEVQGRDGPIGFTMDLHGIPLIVSEFVEGQKLGQYYGLEHVALETDDLPSVEKKLRASGSHLLEEREAPDGRRVTFYQGPEGFRFEVVEMST